MVFRLVTILSVALLTGLAFAHVLESPAKMQYNAQLYVTLQKSLYVQWGPPHGGGVLEPFAIASTGLLVFSLRGKRRSRMLSLGALGLLLLAFPVVFFLWVAPANAAFHATVLPQVPAGWAELRSQWERGHALRFVLQFTALTLLVLSLSREGRARQDA